MTTRPHSPARVSGPRRGARLQVSRASETFGRAQWLGRETGHNVVRLR